MLIIQVITNRPDTWDTNNQSPFPPSTPLLSAPHPFPSYPISLTYLLTYQARSDAVLTLKDRMVGSKKKTEAQRFGNSWFGNPRRRRHGQAVLGRWGRGKSMERGDSWFACRNPEEKSCVGNSLTTIYSRIVRAGGSLPIRTTTPNCLGAIHIHKKNGRVFCGHRCSLLSRGEKKIRWFLHCKQWAQADKCCVADQDR